MPLSLNPAAHLNRGPRATAPLTLPRSAGLYFAIPVAMASVVHQCPTTGWNVQAWFDDDTPADESLTYVSLRCPACAESVSSTGTARRLVTVTEVALARTAAN